MKTGECKYGSKCRFNHPKEKLDSSIMDEQSFDANQAATSLMPIKPASAFNSRGLPLRPVSEYYNAFDKISCTKFCWLHEFRHLKFNDILRHCIEF